MQPMPTTTDPQATIRELRAACHVDSERLEIQRTVILDAIRARLAAASPGPWYMHRADSVIRILCRTSTHTVNKIASVLKSCRRQREDADLIVNAPADLAWLIDHADRLRAERDVLLKHATDDAMLAFWTLRAEGLTAERKAGR